MSKKLVSKFSATSTPTMYALLVGIDGYPQPAHRLRGCRNDVEAMAGFLQEHVEGREVQLRTLLDKEASRERMIAAWLDFKVAKRGDVCLFYFSGHGSAGKSPAFFHHIDVNGQMQSIVCYDSRSRGGRDLTDKELSQLTWEVTFDQDQQQDKGIHLATIFDCCHAGGNTKEAERDRGIDEGVIPAELHDFFGFENFDQQVIRGKIYYSPKRGPHIQLAAAGEKEKAKEQLWDGKHRGGYTYLLLEVLKDHQAGLSYAQLQQALFMRMQHELGRQTPQLDSLGITAKHQPFLHLKQQVAAQAFILSCQKELGQWLVQLGHIHGLAPEDTAKIQFYVAATDSQHSVAEIYLAHAALADFTHADPNKVFLTELKQLGEPRLSFSSSETIQKNLAPFAGHSPYFKWVTKEEDGYYHIVEQADEVCILRKGNCIYRASIPESSLNATHFVNQLEKIAKWHRIRAISNAHPHIKPSHYQIKWYKQEGADAYPNENEAPLQLIPSDAEKAPFSYIWGHHYKRQQMEWLEPAFRLHFTNQSGKPLYLTGLYLQADFQVTDRFCPPILLDPGQSFDFQYRTKSGRLYQSIFLSIYPEWLKQNVRSITEYIKLFISYKPFDMEMLKQDGLYTELVSATAKADPSKGIGNRMDHLLGGPRDWTVKTLALTIIKPEK